MIRIIRVAALQLRAHDRDDFPSSLETIIASTREAACNVDLIVLPEATLPAYVLGAAPIDEKAIARALDRLREIAAATETVIVVGAAHVRDGATRNAAFAIDADGSLAGDTDKLFLWHFDRRWFARGERLEPIVTAIGTLGVLICADGRIPTIARTLVDRGASALVMPTAWVTSGRNPDALENALERMTTAIRSPMQGTQAHPVTIESATADGRTFHDVRDDKTGTILAYYTFADGYMIVAPDRALIIDALRIQASGSSLARSASFRALLPRDGNENYSAVAYQNLSPVLTPLLSQFSGETADALRKLAADARPTVVCAWGQDNRIEAASDSSLFGFDFLTLGAILDRNKMQAPRVPR